MTTAATDSVLFDVRSATLAAVRQPIDGIHLWLAELDSATAQLASNWLSPSEMARAAKFVFQRDVGRYQAAHVHLRQLLWERWRIPAGAEFEIGMHGKPQLPSTAHGFNLSHSEARALIGLSTHEHIGVDIEVLRPIADLLPLAERTFTPRERQGLHSLGAAAADAAFLTVWTRKEACLKALGSGLAIEPSSFEVGVTHAAESVSILVANRQIQLRVQSIALDDRALAAVARVITPFSANLLPQ